MAADLAQSGVPRRRLRPIEFALLLALALFSVYEIYYQLLPEQSIGAIFGWNVATDGVTVSYVTPDGPVDRAGIRVGDKIEWSSLPLLGRLNLIIPQAAQQGAMLTFRALHNNRMHSYTLHAVPFDVRTSTAQRLGSLAALIVQYIAMALVWLRPSRLTWAFLLFEGTPNFYLSATNSIPQFAFNYIGYALSAGASIAGAFLFVSRFPSNEPRNGLRWLDRLAIPIGIAFSSFYLTIFADLFLSKQPPLPWTVITYQYLAIGLTNLVVVFAIARSAYMARGSVRQRILPVLGALALQILMGLVYQYYNYSFTAGFTFFLLAVILDISNFLVAIAVVNGVIRDRVIDVSFTLSRTVVYTILTTFLVGIFVLIEFVSSKFLERLDITLYLEAAAALVFGITLKSLHKRVDHFVDSVVFRRRHLAEQRLHRTSRTMMHSENERFIDEALVVEAMDAMDLASAALFRKIDDGSFERVLSEGWSDEHTATLAQHDHLIVHLTAELEPVDLTALRWPNASVPGGTAHPLVAIPVIMRHQLLGFILYGGHNGGEAIDPDEQSALTKLADAAGPAYEHIRMMRLSRASEQWTLEKALLEHEQRLLREMIDALRPSQVS